MKKLLILLTFLMCFNQLKVMSQMIPMYPIPSYNVQVEGYATFRPTFSHPGNTDEKRDLHIRLRSDGLPGTCNATIWLYTSNHQSVLGPYYVSCEQELIVAVDEQDWNVLVETTDMVSVDVWYSD